MHLNFHKKEFNFTQIFSILIIFIIIFIYKFNFIVIEPMDSDILRRIIEPNLPKGNVNYDPHYNFIYLVFYLYKILLI